MKYRKISQIVLLITGIAMISYGVVRGEAAAVLSKAIKLCLESGEISFDTIKREAYAKGKKVSLTRKENGILEYLLLNLGRPVSQEELMEHVWDASVDSFSGAIRVHMSSLRRKLKAVLGYDPILNKVGEGYKIREEADR